MALAHNRRINALVFFALIIFLLVYLALICHWEPVLVDGWGHTFIAKRDGITLDGLLRFTRNSYLAGNPRIGQLFTRLTHAEAPIHVILTPCVEVLFLLLLVALARGRMPRATDLGDSFMLVLAFTIVWLIVPLVGPIFFYRPFTTNYLYGFCFVLILALPYRLELASPRPATRASWVLAVALLPWGVVAGMTNEHTGLATIAALLGVMALSRHRRNPLKPWMFSGVLGLFVGYLMLLLAPGQGQRYGGLANEQSLIGRIISRGLYGNLAIFEQFMEYAFPLAGLVLLIAILRLLSRSDEEPPERMPRAMGAEIAVYLALAFLMVGTLLASPKQGPRLFFAPMVLVVIAGLIALEFLGRGRWLRGALLVICLGLCCYYLSTVYTTYRLVDAQFRARMHQLESAPKGSVVAVELFANRGRTKFFMGDDFRMNDFRRQIARRHFGLRDITIKGRPVTRSGFLRTDMDLSFEYEFDGALDALTIAVIEKALPDFNLERDLRGARATFRKTVRRISALVGRAPARARLVVSGLDFTERGQRPIYLATFEDDRVMAVTASLDKKERNKPQTVSLAGLAASEQSRVFAIVLGDKRVELARTPDQSRLAFALTPWRTAHYLFVACTDSECYLARRARVRK